MTGSGGLSRRRSGALRRPTCTSMKVQGQLMHRKSRKGWAQWM